MASKMIRICSRCGSQKDLKQGKSGGWFCSECRAAYDGEVLHLLRMKAWRQQVMENESNLNCDVAEANRMGVSYGNYIAMKKDGFPFGRCFK